jgi:hypothetical protein
MRRAATVRKGIGEGVMGKNTFFFFFFLKALIFLKKATTGERGSLVIGESVQVSVHGQGSRMDDPPSAWSACHAGDW